jgi:hypothetical protein
MVAYSFKPSFVPLITSGVKQQTIRLPRKRHARPGETLQLFHGPRMKPVRIGSAICLSTSQVRLDFKADVVSIDDAIEIRGDDQLNAFATRDGFGDSRTGVAPWEFMSRWWSVTHPDQPVFAGVLVDWGDTFGRAG